MYTKKIQNPPLEKFLDTPLTDYLNFIKNHIKEKFCKKNKKIYLKNQLLLNN